MAFSTPFSVDSSYLRYSLLDNPFTSDSKVVYKQPPPFRHFLNWDYKVLRCSSYAGNYKIVINVPVSVALLNSRTEFPDVYPYVDMPRYDFTFCGKPLTVYPDCKQITGIGQNFYAIVFALTVEHYCNNTAEAEEVVRQLRHMFSIPLINPLRAHISSRLFSILEKLDISTSVPYRPRLPDPIPNLFKDFTEVCTIIDQNNILF